MPNTDADTSQPMPDRKRTKGAIASVPSKPITKSGTVIKLLLRSRGATPLELIAATDWQPHTIRAFLSGLRKKGRVLVREARKSGDAAYRIKVPPAISALAEPPLPDTEVA